MVGTIVSGAGVVLVYLKEKRRTASSPPAEQNAGSKRCPSNEVLFNLKSRANQSQSVQNLRALQREVDTISHSPSAGHGVVNKQVISTLNAAITHLKDHKIKGAQKRNIAFYDFAAHRIPDFATQTRKPDEI